MFMVGLFSWWYGNGWKQRATNLWLRTMKVADFFSVNILISTLFSPFRQIAGSGGGKQGLAGAMSAFFDTLVSRFVGFFARTFMILIGLIVIVFQGILSLVIIICWPLVPLMPVAGAVLAIVGWLPL
jgi:hypothetical protein